MAAALAPGHPAVLRRPDEVASSVLKVVLERLRAGSSPRCRQDDHTVCLVVEGGGMRGAVSAGMCVLLEAAGAVPAFDRIYGVSAGALNGCATATGQAALSATVYRDAAARRVINRARPLLGRPVIDFELLFGDIIGKRKPLAIQGLATGPEFRALATSLETRSLRVLADFADSEEMLQAVRASAALPVGGAAAPRFRGEPMVDGGLIEPIPYETAITEGATHVLVLRSRPPAYRKSAVMEVGEALALRGDPDLLELYRARSGTYNRQAAVLARATAWHDARLLQVAVPNGTRLIGRLDSNDERVVRALRVGARAMASVILNESVDLCWQPAVYRAVEAIGAVEASSDAIEAAYVGAH
jgi:predicted patatin/cPLA2 family phospholipase